MEVSLFATVGAAAVILLLTFFAWALWDDVPSIDVEIKPGT